MRISPQRHTLAVLRTVIGITQKEMAKLLQCSVPTVQAIELGKLKMSPRLAINLANQTDVNLAWLMKDDVSVPPTDTLNKPYTREAFEHFQALLFGPAPETFDLPRQLSFTRASFRLAVDYLAITFARAYRDKRIIMAAYKFGRNLEAYRADIFGDITLTKEEEARLDRGAEADKPEDLHAVIDNFLNDTEEIYTQRQTQLGVPKTTGPSSKPTPAPARRKSKARQKR